MPILVTGAAGFIGFHLSKKLLEDGLDVVGLDSMNNYYDVSLKNSRLEILEGYKSFSFYKQTLEDYENLSKLFKKYKFKRVINLAAQAGVRYSITNPNAYLNANLHGFLNVLEVCRHFKVEHLIYASSSSVYGANTSMPFKVNHNVDHPISLYAATKKSNELLAHSYASNFGLPVTGLRFFTVYGPWGRPDMALFLFTKAILENKSIDVFNYGKMKRDFTYVDDIVEGVYRLINHIPTGKKDWDSAHPDPGSSFAPYSIYNIGNNNPIELMTFIEAIENEIGRKAIKNYLPIQVGDVPETFADVSSLENAVGYKPQTSVQVGVRKFINWYRDYYKV
ncbi:NAD-dependent epimerase [Ekhidna sp.]|uniref:NAD-dependent epimerase n=1 Tax=Ekhidna sp. TaxID=2608089 RepID=UPI003B50210B